MDTPQFQGTHLWDRLCWAKENLEPIQCDYRVVYEDPNYIDAPCKILVPDPNFCAAFVHGGIIPKIENYWVLAEDEAKPDFVKHTRGYLLHNTEPMPAGTLEECLEFLIMKDIPQHIWRNWNEGNKPKLVICRKDQLPATREWRNAWKISDDLQTEEKAA